MFWVKFKTSNLLKPSTRLIVVIWRTRIYLDLYELSGETLSKNSVEKYMKVKLYLCLRLYIAITIIKLTLEYGLINTLYYVDMAKIIHYFLEYFSFIFY
jgi:uncharacterized membrane protein